MMDEQQRDEVARLEKRVERERKARQEAERLAEKGIRQLYERKRALELLNAITDAANGAASVHEAIQVTLDQICAYTRWPVGHAYFLSEGGESLVPSGIWHLDQPAERFEVFRGITEATTFQRGEGLPGTVLESRRSFWIPDVSRAANFPRARHSLEIGVVAAFALPVLTGSTVVAVLEFFSSERVEMEEAWLDIATQTGIQLGRIFERQRASAELEKAHQELVELSRLKSEFLANMSHEIRTPINGVIGMTDLLLMTELSSEQQEFARIVRISGESLLGVINDILDFSKIEAGKLELDAAPFNLREIVEDTMELLAPQAHGKGLDLAAFIRPDVPLELRGDSARLRQILTNLVGNAVKFTSRGEVIATVGVIAEGAGHVTLGFEVRDTGIGIDPIILPKLFQAFSQADGSNSRKYGGTGLGLVIAKKLVTLMGGEIEVRSEVGKGSSFAFTARIEKQAVAASAVVLPDLSGLRVLIVEDNAMCREILDHHARSWKMSSSVASTSDEALALLRRAAGCVPYDVAILDLQMPGMDGLALARAIKADPAISSTRLIMLTSLGKQPSPEEIRQVGVDECVLKPVKESRLFARLAEVLVQRMPSPQEQVELAARALPEAAVPEQGTDSVRILLAEDNLVNQKVMRGILRKLGYEPDIANNGLEALEALDRQTYHVVLMDCQMPELDGYEATRRIRSRPDGAHLPVIAITAHVMPGESEKCFAAGMDDYLSKPVRLELLREKLERWIARAGSPVPEIDTTRDPEF